MKLTGIYKITSPSGKIYIGQSVDLKRRITSYKSNLNSSKCQIKLHNSFTKYGIDAYKFEIIELCLENYLNNMERYYQEKYKSVENGLNLRYTASNDKSGKMSAETKKKMSDSWVNRTPNIEPIKVYQFVKGQKHLEETKKKISNSLKGKKKNPEHIAKLWQNQKGAKMPKRSEATKQLQSLNNGKNRAVLQYDLDMNFIKEYRSAMLACRELGISRNITACCQGKLKQSGGFIWRYKNS